MRKLTSLVFSAFICTLLLQTNLYSQSDSTSVFKKGTSGFDSVHVGFGRSGLTTEVNNTDRGIAGGYNLNEYNTILKFWDLNIPSGAVIDSAFLELTRYGSAGTLGNTYIASVLKEVDIDDFSWDKWDASVGSWPLTAWDSAGTKNIGNDITLAGSDTINVGTAPSTITFDVTELVKASWGTDSTRVNNGWLIRAVTTVSGTYYEFYSQQSTSYGPELTVHWSFPDPPSAPTGVTATDGSVADHVKINWNGVTGATSYKVLRATSSGGAYSLVTTTSDTTYNDTGAPAYSVNAPTSISATDNETNKITLSWSGQSLTPGDSVWYKIIASNVGGESDTSSFDPGFRDDTLPVASAEIDTSFSGSSGFGLFQSDESSPYVHTGLPDGDSVWYRIRVQSTAGTYSTYSDTVVGVAALTGFISGVAIDSISGNALSNVVVTTIPASVTDTTDSGGNFFLNNVQVDTFTVVLNKEFYKEKTVTSVVVTAGDTTALGNVEMVAKDSFGVFINIDFDDGTNTNNLQFGFHPEGTDGFDTIFDEAQLPPKPQSGAFLDTRFINGTSLGEGSLIDIRNNDQTSIDYTVHLQRISSTDNITVTWDSIGAIGKDFTLIELINGTVPGQTVNMVSNTTHTITNDDVDRVLITAGPGTFVTWSNNYAQGWNLVSLGGEYVSNSLGFIFPTANSPAYRFNTGTEAYESVTTLEPGVGYFVDFATAYNVARTATIIDTLSLSLVSGWNMIGTTSGPVALSDIDDPSSVVVSIYKNTVGIGYTLVTDSLRQGEGYWMNASGTGTIELVGEPLTKGGSGIYYLNTISDEDKVFSINVDTDYGDQLLNIYSGEGSREVNRSFSLPPMAPYQRTAVRFNLDDIQGMNGLYVTEGESLEGTITIKVPDDNQMLMLRWDNSNLKAGEYFLRDGVDGAIFADVDMAEQTELSLSGLNIDQVLFEYEGRAPVVEDYALLPNYPNPFNPETNISYKIKEAGLVKLTIYNILGQEVRTLVRSIRNAGSFTVKWDGRDNFGRSVAGGMYIYRLEAKGFTASRKLLLIK